MSIERTWFGKLGKQEVMWSHSFKRYNNLKDDYMTLWTGKLNMFLSSLQQMSCWMNKWRPKLKEVIVDRYIFSYTSAYNHNSKHQQKRGVHVPLTFYFLVFFNGGDLYTEELTLSVIGLNQQGELQSCQLKVIELKKNNNMLHRCVSKVYSDGLKHKCSRKNLERLPTS